jgi:ribosome biogenesis GTPase
MNGTIIALNFGTYLVDIDHIIYQCHFPKTNKHQLKPIVGDYVRLNEEKDAIVEVLPRQSMILRPRIANLKTLFVVTSLVEPDYSFLLNAMFITFANQFNLKVILVITKVDKVDSTNYPASLSYFKNIGIPIIFYSKVTKEGLADLVAVLKEGIYAFSGQTGVGKSSIINTINPLFSRSIGEYSKALGRGKHQTKEVILSRYEQCFIADTPGFSSLELEMTKQEAARLFPGFEHYLSKCKFSNCTHLSEPQCAVIEDVKHGKISEEVYEAYVHMIEKLPFHKEYE